MIYNIYFLTTDDTDYQGLYSVFNPCYSGVSVVNCFFNNEFYLSA